MHEFRLDFYGQRCHQILQVLEEYWALVATSAKHHVGTSRLMGQKLPTDEIETAESIIKQTAVSVTDRTTPRRRAKHG